MRLLPLASIPVFAGLLIWRATWRDVPWNLIWIDAILSVLCFVVYAVDKSAARNDRWRISERNLLLVGLLGGWPGAVIAQQALRHKTRKSSFQWAFWGTVTVNVVLVLAFV